MTFDLDPLEDMTRYPSTTVFRTARKQHRCDSRVAHDCHGIEKGQRYALIKFPPGRSSDYAPRWTTYRECEACAEYCTRGEPLFTAQREAEAWNNGHQRGTAVRYWPGERTGPGVVSKTRSPAWALCHGHAVVSVDGYAGGIALTHVEVIESGDAS